MTGKQQQVWPELSASEDVTAGILLGRTIEGTPRRSVGFHLAEGQSRDVAKSDLVTDSGDGHVMVLAPTGAGKGRNLIIPTAGSYTGPMVIIDPKGEAARVTARCRRELGQKVIVLDFCQITGLCGGSLNPFDLIDPASPDFEAECYMLTKQITGGQFSLQDRFWDNGGEALMTGLIAYICQFCPPEQRNLATLRTMLADSDLGYRLAVLLDTVLAAHMQSLAATEFQNFLGHEREKVQSSVRSTAMQHMTPFASAQVQSAISRSSFDLSEITSGEPITIYIVIPPHKLEAYGALLRLWVATLLTLITRRTTAPALPTLFVLDELAQLGSFPLLRPAVTLMRGYGLRTMLVLQDVSQLRAMFPADHPTIVNNCATIVTFGHGSYAMSKELADLLGDIPADSLFAMGRDRLAVRRSGRATEIISRIDYLSDPMFAAKFDPNSLVSDRVR